MKAPWLLLCLCATAQAGTWLDRAEVVAVEPEMTTLREAVEERSCHRAVTRKTAPADLPGADIRAQLRLRRKRCAWRRTWHEERRPRGYWVTYEYRGHRHRRFQKEAPGDWIPVEVGLDPLMP